MNDKSTMSLRNRLILARDCLLSLFVAVIHIAHRKHHDSCEACRANERVNQIAIAVQQALDDAKKEYTVAKKTLATVTPYRTSALKKEWN